MDDLDFADDVTLLAHNHNQMQEKTTQMEESAGNFGLSAGMGITKSMRICSDEGLTLETSATHHIPHAKNILYQPLLIKPVTTNNSSIMLEKGAIENVSLFTYLGSIVITNGGTDEDVKARRGKARAALTGIEITLARSSMATGFCFGKQKIWKITLFSPEWRARNLILICTLKSTLSAFG